MAKITSVIVAAAIVAVSIATPALAAHKGKPITARQNGHVTRSRPGSGVYAPALPSDYDPGARSYDKLRPIKIVGSCCDLTGRGWQIINQ